MAKHWADIGESGTVLGMRFLFWIYRWFGRWAFTLCLYPVVLYFYVFRGDSRRASIDYLNKVQRLGGIPQQADLRWWSFKHFIAFGQSSLDKLAAWTGAFNYKNVTFHQRNEFLTMVDQSKGAVVIISHLGNQEVCRTLADQSRPFKLNILVHTKHAEKFNRMMAEVDKSYYLNLIQVSEITPATAIMLQEKIDAGEVICIAGDRTPVSGGKTVDADFLGQPAPFPQGPFILAAVLKCPVYLLFSVRGKKQYDIYFEHFADRIDLQRKKRLGDIAVWAQQFADRLSYYTLRYPLQWNNFYNFWHNAGKPTNHLK